MRRTNLHEHELNAVLNDWAKRHALPASQAERIRHAVTLQTDPPTVELSIAWWHRLFGTMATALRQSTELSRYLCYPRE